MKPEKIQEVRELLVDQRVLALSVLLDGAPYVGLLPYALAPDFAFVLVHASGLARHTRGLQHGAPYGLLIHRPDAPDADPLQIPRLSFQGAVEKLDRGSEQYDEGRQLYVQRFPSSEPTFGLGDFDLYRLRLEKGRYVGGFAQALNVGASDLQQPA